MRKVLFWLHLLAALSAGVVIVIMSVTGVLLMYEKQIVRWADGYRIEPGPVTPVSVEALLKAAVASGPDATATTLTLLNDPQAPAAVSFGREGTVFLNPRSAEVLGSGSARTRAFFRSMTDWHRWLAMSGDDRATGRAITGASNLVFLFIVLSGLYLWFPRTWSPSAVRSVLVFRRGLEGKARDFNWHNVIGFWLCLPLALVVATAATISYPWASDLLYRISGNDPPPRPSSAAPGPGVAPTRPTVTAPDVTGLDPLFDIAASHTPAWRSLSLRVPVVGDSTITLTIDTSSAGIRPDLRSQLVMERQTLRIVRHETYESQNRGRQLRTWARWLHTGEAFGLPGQTVAGLASAGAVVLAWTGFLLSWRRFRAWRLRRLRDRERAGVVAPDVVTT